ncbi:hypothetical protein COS79_02825 [Candidatus Woesearchaeota archaeon CG06_land_8_20_14_3_00_33_13]|nr:MAG: hypothetical protein COS79_02825 [Candidatus Woesearchaeota archaeon CG06_land_8_20_14_3_00_33_13]
MFGFFSRINLSLNVPGSPSSAFAITYFSPWELLVNSSLSPVGKLAPPRPLSPDFFTSSITSSGFIPAILLSALKFEFFSICILVFYY